MDFNRRLDMRNFNKALQNYMDCINRQLQSLICYVLDELVDANTKETEKLTMVLEVIEKIEIELDSISGIYAKDVAMGIEFWSEIEDILLDNMEYLYHELDLEESLEEYESFKTILDNMFTTSITKSNLLKRD